ncbi:hypothetical protein EYR38_005054 [Pleurotus pulmonarius]|nr:hypothetical protein EYR38_005054 [Pleurotus pulmonarius]
MGHLFAFLVGAGVATWYARHHSSHHSPQPERGPYYSPAAGYPPQAERSKEWDEQRARFRDMSAQAGNTMMDVTESTLDVMQVAVQTLKEKLAEHRSMRMEHPRPVSPPQDQTKLWEHIFNSLIFHERKTLYTLLYVSHRLHDIVKPIFYETVIIRTSESSPELATLYRCIGISQDSETQPSAPSIRHIVFHVGPEYSETMRGKWAYLFHIIMGLRVCLESVMIYGDPAPSMIRHFLQSADSLKHFGWIYDSIPRLVRYEIGSAMLQHSQLERLEMHTNFNRLSPSPTDVPNLRYLSASLRNILYTLPGRNITHLQTSFFDGGDNLIPRAFPDNHSVQSLSCHSQDLRTLRAFTGHLRNLECLELHRARNVTDWWQYYEPPSNPFRFIRFAREMSGRGYGCARTLFELIPSLEAVEVHRHHPKDPAPSTYSLRWYRGKTNPVKVEWDCFLGEEWWHDWERDVQISPISM